MTYYENQWLRDLNDECCAIANHINYPDDDSVIHAIGNLATMLMLIGEKLIELEDQSDKSI